MFTTLRNRFIVIAILVIGSALSLFQNYRQHGSPLNLGLDLQGGMHLALEPDETDRKAPSKGMDRIEIALNVLRKRIDEFGVSERNIQKVGDNRIVVELPGVTDYERAREMVSKVASLEFRFTDETDALSKAIPSMDRALRQLGIKARTGSGDTSKSSAVKDLLGGDSASKVAEDSSQVITDGILASMVQRTEMPGEFAVKESDWKLVDSLINKIPQVKGLIPRNIVLRWSSRTASGGVESIRYLYALEDRIIVTGTNVVSAVAEIDPTTNGPVVNFELDRRGGKKFGEETAKHIGDYLAILLDNQIAGRPPYIKSQINRRGQIEMQGRALTEAQDLAVTLRAGALPVPLKIVDQKAIGPSLGADSIKDGILAGVVGTLLVILIMAGYYAMGGLLAIGALILYTLFTFGGLSLFAATLTLPGLAGFVLSIGIAVDANVLIFERMREELGFGKTARLAVEEGFKHAMPAIIDSNISTVLTALFLFQFGTGPVKGFAVTLIVGIFASMITAVFVTRTFYLWWLRRSRGDAVLSLGKARLFHNANYDFMSVKRFAFGLTGLLLVIGVVAGAIRKINYSVEFTGGTLVQIKTDPSVTEGTLRAGLPHAEIVRYGAPADGEFVVRVRAGESAVEANNTQLARARVDSALKKTLGTNYTIERTESVSGKVGGELRGQAFLAIFLSFFAVLAYLAYRFEWRFGVAAVVATLHDVVLTICFLATFKLEVSLVVVAAFLTVVGYSLNDTIIIFDRIRENLHKHRRDTFEAIVNRSINETLPRSILTHGTTLATLFALTIFGGQVIRPFALVMFFGVFTGTFSSIFIASPVLLWIEKKWPPKGERVAAPRATPVAAAPTTRRPSPVG